MASRYIDKMITPQNVVKHELIGLHAEVVNSKNKADVGIKGKIVDESHHTINIETGRGEKKLFKKNITLKLKLPSSQEVEVDGEVLEAKPWDRIKLR